LKAKVYMFFAQPNPAQPYLPAGVLNIEQNPGNIRINGMLTGFSQGQHGFHVHESGDLGRGCLDALAHYNPFTKDHGAPGQFFRSIRHVGDLGNLMADRNGNIVILNTFLRVGLFGANSILGRGLVVHANRDDLGLGGDQGSRTTGNAGGRVACGVIGRVVSSHFMLIAN
uniref:Superoxide dismutase [Cu-Zn] n=1 Tax=Anisakis simplex TaxID=6269 RepID=A0A0M3JZV6_ANISI